jgi:hypothetical protein
VVIDHLGLLQPNQPPPLAEPWADLPKLLALATHDNVRVKISGACTLSRELYPYNDIWDPVLRIIDAFGIDRCMWGTDWTRTSGMLSYEQGVAAFRNTNRLSDGDKAKLMGATLEKMPSRPGESHPEPLTGPYMRLSPHTARATHRRLPPSIETAGSSGFPLTRQSRCE